MPNDIGLDLGTTKIVAYDSQRGLLFNEPNVVAVNTESGEVLAVGSEAYLMLGRTPEYIRAQSPMEGGIISDYDMTNAIIRYTLKRICGESYLKPRVAVCVPSIVTDVEQRAVVDAALSAGARKVYLIDEPVAAAIGSGIDISKSRGRFIVDIGGGTTDIALLSLSGIVAKHSVKIAGRTLDEAIAKYIKTKYELLIGPRMAEAIKQNVGTLSYYEDDRFFEVKGRNLISGLPRKVLVSWQEIKEVMLPHCEEMANHIMKVFEKAPPELSGDIREDGIYITGGGSLLDGIDVFFSERFHVPVTRVPDPIGCVAKGTAASFALTGYLRDCVNETQERFR